MSSTKTTYLFAFVALNLSDNTENNWESPETV